MLGGALFLLGGFWTGKLFPLIDARLLSKYATRMHFQAHPYGAVTSLTCHARQILKTPPLNCSLSPFPSSFFLKTK